jgi:hypothetical protein
MMMKTIFVPYTDLNYLSYNKENHKIIIAVQLQINYVTKLK